MSFEEPMQPTLVDRRWMVTMPEHRAQRPGWSYWEQERLSYMHAVIRPGDVVWEIGAELGDVSVLYALWGADVVLVEPDAGFWPHIKRIFEANGVADKVVGTYHGFVDREVGDGYELGASRQWPVCVGDEFHVTLDVMLDLFPHPNVVSMDIEGAEYQALLGADRLLAEVKPILFVSVHPYHLWEQHHDTPDDVWVHLDLHGYDAERVGRDHEIHVIGKPR